MKKKSNVLRIALLDLRVEYATVITVPRIWMHRSTDEQPEPDLSLYNIKISYKAYKSVEKEITGKLSFCLEERVV